MSTDPATVPITPDAAAVVLEKLTKSPYPFGLDDGKLRSRLSGFVYMLVQGSPLEWMGKFATLMSSANMGLGIPMSIGLSTRTAGDESNSKYLNVDLLMTNSANRIEIHTEPVCQVAPSFDLNSMAPADIAPYQEAAITTLLVAYLSGDIVLPSDLPPAEPSSVAKAAAAAGAAALGKG